MSHERLIHAVCSMPNYRRHVEAVWKHIDPLIRGELRYGRSASTRDWAKEDVVMVGGFYDIDRVPNNPIVYVEHGAGQSYSGDDGSIGNPAYHGSQHPENVIGYISPNERVAASWGRPAFVAGCPALDDIVRVRTAIYQKTAAITFHWDAHRVCPEARSAKPYWLDDIHSIVNMLRSEKLDVIGTWHPRDPFGRSLWDNLNVEAVEDPDEVLARADLLIADNTSLMYEAAHLGTNVLALNAPWYRQDVEHGLRFWDHVPGKTVDTIEQMAGIYLRSYITNSEATRMAKDAAAYAYGLPRGDAGQQAARWIEKLASDLT